MLSINKAYIEAINNIWVRL